MATPPPAAARLHIIMPLQALEQQLLDQLAEQTSAEKSARRTVHDTKALRASIQQKEAQLQDLQAQLDKMQAEYDSTRVRLGGLGGLGGWWDLLGWALVWDFIGWCAAQAPWCCIWLQARVD
jgi:hypothetical protein